MRKLGMLAVALSASLSAFAYDFEADGICYNIIDQAAVEVTYNSLLDPSYYYSGDIVVPASVSYNNEQYAVTTIGGNAFYRCSGLTSITIPNSVTTIGVGAFASCISLTNIDVAVDNQAYLSNYGILYDKPMTTLLLCPCGKPGEITIPNTVTTIGMEAFFGCKGLTSIVIPNTVTTIEQWAFKMCSGLTSITLSNSVTYIGFGAFGNCSSLTSITIPNSVTTIEKYAFEACYSLTSITIPNSVTTIGGNAFYRCSGLTSITIPNSVTTIGVGAFASCISLTNIDVAVDNQAYSSNYGILYDKPMTTLLLCPCGKPGEITIPNTVTTIGIGAFEACYSLISIAIPNSVTTIEKFAFYDCTSLTSIVIPNSVTTIEENAFVNCSSLTSITIPNSVTTIGCWAFSDCSGLYSITSLAVTPPECGADAFYNIDKYACTLYVTAESIEAYKSAPEWQDFFHVEAAESGIESVEAASAGATEVFDLSGVKVADSPDNLPAGIYIVRTGSTVRIIAVR